MDLHSFGNNLFCTPFWWYFITADGQSRL